MEDKHIFSTSKWVRFKDFLKDSQEQIKVQQKNLEKFREERKKAKVASLPATEIKSTQTFKVPEKRKSSKKSQTKVVSPTRLTSEAGNKLLIYSLIISVVVIMLVGIIVGTIGSRKQRKRNYSIAIPTILPTATITPSLELTIMPTFTPTPSPVETSPTPI